MTLPPLSLYIHVPWCIRKCPYCDFNSHAKQGDLPQQDYIAAMLADLDEDLAFVQGRPVHTVFIGGGTPSLFSPRAYRTLFEEMGRRLTFTDDCEITLEANPGTLEQGRFEGYRDAGINRLSIGVQSFDSQQLQKLGRIHSADDALGAIERAQLAGFDNFNIDLMHGLSGQDTAQAERDLRQAMAAGAPHISWYQLTIEPNTEFYKRPPSLPVETDLDRIQQSGFRLLSGAGFERYEVSAYARPGYRARHNLNYWRFGDYLALGAGAHGKITQADGGIVRYQKTRKPEDYLQRSGSRTSKEIKLASADLPLEFMMNALRLSDGFNKTLFCQRTGRAWATVQEAVERLVAEALLEDDGRRLRCSRRGFEVLDSVLAQFLPE